MVTSDPGVSAQAADIGVVKLMITLTTMRTERMHVLRARAVVYVRRWTVDRDCAGRVERAILRPERRVVAGIRNDRTALRVPTSLLRSKQELETGVC